MKKLKEMRLKKNFTCQDMANILSISKAYYWQLENNCRKLSYEMAIKISDIFETTPDNIFYKEYKAKKN